jgi:hypothetical protein
MLFARIHDYLARMTIEFWRPLRAIDLLLLLALLADMPHPACAQAGPPFLTNDPGTPGNANWEINLASMQTVSKGAAAYQVPQIDLNFGVGDRIQLTYEIPYVITTSNDQPDHGAWGNGNPGIKWRFLDLGQGNWQMSVFPQVQTGGSQVARASGIAVAGPRYLLPFEVTKKIGPLDVDLELGYYVAGHASGERIMGIAAGRPVTKRLELDAEIYDDHPNGSGPHTTTLDVGGRFRLREGLLALFMVGRSIDGFSQGQPLYMGYFGVQILLSDYGRRWTTGE